MIEKRTLLRSLIDLLKDEIDRRLTEELKSLRPLTRERVRQIEARALRRLRFPSGTRKLQGFLWEQDKKKEEE